MYFYFIAIFIIIVIFFQSDDYTEDSTSVPIAPMNINTCAAAAADSIEPDIDGDVPKSAGRGDVIRNAQVRLRCNFTLLLY